MSSGLQSYPPADSILVSKIANISRGVQGKKQIVFEEPVGRPTEGSKSSRVQFVNTSIKWKRIYPLLRCEVLENKEWLSGVK